MKGKTWMEQKETGGNRQKNRNRRKKNCVRREGSGSASLPRRMEDADVMYIHVLTYVV
jgi:hypothetical protein